MKRALSRKNLWESIPRSLKETAGRILGLIPPKCLLGRRFRENMQFIRGSQFWDPERIRVYQVEQLTRICCIAYERTAFYRRLFDSVGFDPRRLTSPEDLAVLPTIDRRTLTDHLSEMCTISPDAPCVDYVATGGTSGRPLAFYIEAGRSSIEYSYLVSSWQRINYDLELPLAVFRGRVVAADRSGLHHEYDPALRHHYYSSFHLTDENARRYLDHIARLGPCFLHAYPSSVVALARAMRRLKRTAPPGVRGIITESEILYPEQRTLVEEVFQCRCFSCYSHTEKLVLAAECEHCTDYHVWPTYGYFELLDDSGRPVLQPGQRGEIVGTGFINTVVPFIRYRTGDEATYVGDRCTRCHRFHPLIRDIRGHRTQEVLIAADGSAISWTAINMHDDTFDHVRQFQFYQDRPGCAVLRVVPASRFSPVDANRIRQNLGRKLNGRLTFELETVDAIPLSPRGKAIYVDQQIGTNSE